MFHFRRCLHRLFYMRRVSMSSQNLPRMVSLFSFVLMLTMLTGMIRINAPLSDDQQLVNGAGVVVGGGLLLKPPSRQQQQHKNNKADEIREEIMKLGIKKNDFGQVGAAPSVRPIEKTSQMPSLVQVEKEDKTRKTETKKEDNDDDINNVDIVYTWVNGSDPEHIKLLRHYKALDGWSKLSPDGQRMHQLAEYSANSSKNYKCYHKLCVESKDVLVVTPRLPNHVTGSLSSTDWLDLTDTQIEHRPEFILSNNNNNNYPMPTSLTLIHTADLERIPHADGMRVYKAFYSADCSMAINCIPDVERTYILRRIVVRPRQANRVTTTTKPSSNLPDFIEKHLEWKIHSVGVYDVFVVKMKNDSDLWKRSVQSEDVFDMGFGVSYNLYKASIVWDLGDPNGYPMTAGRFAEHDELKYSLRSVAKNAPWVRKIHIVTNGQVPAWLNLDHPKIRIVTHEQIFTNSSYLPTFSSPAIEANLHRIPGLSKRFIYFNDDIFVMTPVTRDDFWTEKRGFRFQMAWAAPPRNAPPCGQFNTYDCSVRHVSDIYDKAYGIANRRVPAHVPHYFDRDIIASMVSKYSSEFDKTSASRFRRADDMQFAFSFYYYVIHEAKWRYERLGEGDMRFFMIQDKSSLMQQRLDMLKRRPRKFACFNDDIDYGKTNQALKLRQMMARFFDSVFPNKSQYEL